ncbi:DUF262 domain-containing HNH endonuclease family protein [Sphingobacterium daejeonense]|uniref:DUF262 domain-containing protein n=1 Tax=Sphingobacterium daejeonense TaxID=371142 RepID=UPI0021A8D79C|nr:DUF262 domain-containing HNH endonuclease family protein [Sphingobacterium daejeonense]MCT1531010.1 DUF262 domain-containing HNH endonuclease family protein [Sphingobacterium daejeonense]
MLSASKEKLLSFLNNSSQYIIPFFQRGYVWSNDNWSELWENIVEEYRELKSGNVSEHFIGTIIIKQILSTSVGASEYELIDGQQRLTTVCLLLRAFYDSTEDESAKSWIKNFFVFTDSYGNQKIRILHSKVDREKFQDLILNNEGNNILWDQVKDLKIDDFVKKIELSNNIEGAYLFFRRKINEDSIIEDIRTYINIIIEKLPVIHMALNAEDDVQQIFDTINSLGVKLTTAELLKNHLFAKPIVQSYYEQYWFDIFECDDETIDFWTKDKTSGRVRRTTVELFLYSYLVIKKEATVKLENLFKEFKNYLKNKNEDELIEFAKEIHDYALIYRNIPDGDDLGDIAFNDDEKRFFLLMREFEITTLFPVLLYIYKEVEDKGERIDILKIFESYITRRTICRLTTKNYNNLFLSLLGKLKELESINAFEIDNILKSFKEDTNRFPNDDEFKEKFGDARLSNKYSRTVLFPIALYQLNHGYVDNHNLSLQSFSVEHMMPKNWKKHWSVLPEGITEDFRKHKLLTLGNLTLIKGALNSSMRDSAWENKKEVLQQYSTLKITTNYLVENWNEDEIKKREIDLRTLAMKIWQY